MAKQLNVKLNFQADTTQAQQALAQLTTSLNQISNFTPSVGDKLNADLASAKQSALDLQRHLNNAFNIKTGNLDLSKLDASLKSSGQNLGTLSANLLKAGTSGQNAFLNIQRAIGNASVQINQANGVLTQFWTTLKNTARWQLSSSLLHGVIGGLQSAWGYAKDLDKSLNNIRIVTGYGSEEMIKFAEQANKAAKALSTTTTKYTDASLIFYQQGLSAEEVAKRTEVAIKMANVSGQSTQVVADQMTAIWNNFYNGSKSLEYYADVMTALGAATASSTDEIAGGLEKFAAIGETIGLSYEYAAAALATITSNTRQSEEVVGTALKTIFARIQGLNLGETLDDGTTLNKYSEALSKVGISIFEQNGELKKMDDILDEMGSKWTTLSKEQQTALAQTVAGVRQYTQLMSLMNNWDAGDNDSMKANLNTAYNAEGAVNEQQEIYADSWQAAIDRVKASAEGIYKDLFPTEEMTGMMKAFEVILEGVDGLVEGLGGSQGILLLVSSIALNSFKHQIGGAIDDVIAKVGGGLTNAFTNIANAFQTGGIIGGLKAMFNYTGDVVTQTQRLSGELQIVAAHSGDVTKQMKLTEQAMKSGVSQALKMSMEMTQAAQETKDLVVDETFQQYNANLATINNIQASIEKSTRYLTKEQQEQLVIMQEQAQAANEQLLTAQRLANEAKRRKETMLNTGGTHGADIERYVEIDRGRNAGKTAYTTDLLNTGRYSKNKGISMGNIGMVNQGLETYTKAVAVAVKQAQDAAKASNGTAEQIKKAGEEAQGTWNRAKVGLDSYKNHLAVVFDESVNLVAVNKEVNTSYSDLVTTSANVSDTISMWGTAAQGVPAAFNQLTEEQRKAYGAAVELDGALDEALDGVRRKSVVNDLKTLTDDQKKAVLAAKELETSLDKALGELGGKGKLGAQLAKEIQAGIKPSMTLQQKADHISKGLAEAAEKMRTLGMATGSSEKDMENIKNGALETRDRIAGTAQAADNLNNKLSQVVGTLQKSLAGAMSFGNILAGAASGLSSIAMGISSIQNAFETFNDEDASFTSKLTAGAMAATMGIRGMMTAMSGISAVVGSVNATLGINEAATMAVAIANKIGAAAVDENNTAELANLLVGKLGMTQDTAEATAKKLVTAAQKGETAATIKDTAANWANVASQAAKLWWITLIIAAVAALAVLIYAVATAEDAETKALKQANEQLENSKNAYDTAKEAAENFKAEIADYQDALNGLQELTAGTQEMADAVEDANKKARELIETYGLFNSGDWRYGSNGEIIINKQALDEAQIEYDNRAKAFEIDYYSAKMNQLKAQQAVDTKSYLNGFGTYTTAKEYTVKNLHGYSQRVYGESLDIDTAQAREYRAASNYLPEQTGVEIKENKLTTAELKALGAAAEQVKDKFGDMPATADEFIAQVKTMGDSCGLSQDIINDLSGVLEGSGYSSLLEFCDGLAQATEASKYYAKQILGLMTDDDYADEIARASGGDQNLANTMTNAKNTILANQKKVDLVGMEQSEQEKLQSTIDLYDTGWDASDDLENALEDYITGLGINDSGKWLEENYSSIFKGSTQTYSGNTNTLGMAKAYAESLGYTINSTEDNNGTISLNVTSADGQTVSDLTYDNEQIQRLWAQKIGNAAIGEYISQQATGVLSEKDLETMFTSIVKNGEQYGADWSTSFMAGVANEGAFDFSSIFAELSPEEYKEIMAMDGTQLAELFGLTPSQLRALGLGSAEEFKTAFQEGLDGWDPTIYSNAMNQKYETIAESHDLDVDEYKAYRGQVSLGKGFENDSGGNHAETWLSELKAEDVEDYTEALNELALMQARLDRGYDSLGTNWKDWNKIMTSSESTMADIAKIMPDINAAMADILNWDMASIDLLPPDFAKQHWDIIEDIYNGVEGAQEKLAGFATQEYIATLNVDTTGVETEYNSIIDWLGKMPDLEVGMSLDDSQMTSAFQALLDSNC